MTVYRLELGTTEHTCRSIACVSMDQLLETAARLAPGVTLTIRETPHTITATVAEKGGVQKHGTYSRYVNRGCRCDECRAAANAEQKRMKAARLADFQSGKIVVGHGLVATYTNYDCRCEDCREAWSKRSQRYYQDRKLAAS